eukprot:Hpha_TRINITY_DN3854_c0_g1::TRINITY_DN3854_c0_g1_i1::g.44482::m.44482
MHRRLISMRPLGGRGRRASAVARAPQDGGDDALGPADRVADHPDGERSLHFWNEGHRYIERPSGIRLAGTHYTLRNMKVAPLGVPSYASRAVTPSWLGDKEPSPRVQEMWREAQRKGSAFHNHAFQILTGEYVPNAPLLSPKDDMDDYLEAFKCFADDLLNRRYSLVGAEQLVWSAECRIAGTIDCLLRCEEPDKEPHYLLLDWKTHTRSRACNDRNLGIEPLGWPFDDCANNRISQYAIQLNVYKNMLVKGGWVDGSVPIRVAIVDFFRKEDGVVSEGLLLDDLGPRVDLFFDALLRAPPVVIKDED